MNNINYLLCHYGLLGSCRLMADKIRTLFLLKQAKLVRFPFEIRGKRNVSIAKGLTTGRYCRVEAYSDLPNKIVLVVGDNCQINDSVHIVAREKVVLGDNVLIASRVFITDLNHGSYGGSSSLHSRPESLVAERPLSSSPVIIGDNCWLGENCSILPGVRLGKNCIVGANSLVNKDFPDDSIIAGNPAQLIKRYCRIEKRWLVVKK